MGFTTLRALVGLAVVSTFGLAVKACFAAPTPRAAASERVLLTARFYVLPGEEYTNAGAGDLVLPGDPHAGNFAFRLTITQRGNIYHLRVVETADATGRGPEIPRRVAGLSPGGRVPQPLPERFLVGDEVKLLKKILADVNAQRRSIPRNSRLPRDGSTRVHLALSFGGTAVNTAFDYSYAGYGINFIDGGRGGMAVRDELVAFLNNAWGVVDRQSTFGLYCPSTGRVYQIPVAQAGDEGLNVFEDAYSPAR